MPITIAALGTDGPPAKRSEGRYRFLCPHCREMLATVNPRNNLAHQVMKDVRKNLRGQVYETVIPRNVRLSEAPSHGRPAILYDIESKGAQSYLQLAEELLQRHRAAAAQLKHA